MIVKLSDFILEQSISDASVNDIALEQYQAEYNVADAMANTYMKSMNLIYVYEAEGQTVTTEAKKDNIFKRIWAAIVKAWKAICEWFKARWEGIKRLFGKGGKVAATANAVASGVADMPQEDVDKMMKPTSQLCFEIGKVVIAGDILSEEFIPLIDEIVEYFDSHKETEASRLDEFKKKTKEILAETDKIMKATRPSKFEASKYNATKEGPTSIKMNEPNASTATAGETSPELLSDIVNRSTGVTTSKPNAALAERYINMGSMFLENKSMSKEQYADIVKKIGNDIDAKIKNITDTLTNKLKKATDNLSRISANEVVTKNSSTGWDEISNDVFSPLGGLNSKTKDEKLAIRGDDSKNIQANTGALAEIKDDISKAAADIQAVVNTAIENINRICDEHFRIIKDYKEGQKKQGKNPTSVSRISDLDENGNRRRPAGMADDDKLEDYVQNWYNKYKTIIDDGYLGGLHGDERTRRIAEIYNNDRLKRAIEQDSLDRTTT